MPLPSKLCRDCAAKHRKEDRGVEEILPGLYSIPMPKTGSCTTCSTEARGFQFCLGCATERAICQGCGHQFNGQANENLSAQIAAHRGVLEAGRAAARSTCEQIIEPFKDEASVYEAALSASEKTFTAACALLDDAINAASQALNKAVSTADREAAGAVYRQTHTDSEQSASRLHGECVERNRSAAAAFPHRATYAQATTARDKELRRLRAIFTAEVDRCVAIADAEDRYARAISNQEWMDRL